MTKVILNVLRFFGADIKNYTKEEFHLFDGEDVRVAIHEAKVNGEKLAEKIPYIPTYEDLILAALHNPEYVTE